jgi:hypothetical protein
MKNLCNCFANITEVGFEAKVNTAVLNTKRTDNTVLLIFSGINGIQIDLSLFFGYLCGTHLFFQFINRDACFAGLLFHSPHMLTHPSGCFFDYFRCHFINSVFVILFISTEIYIFSLAVRFPYSSVALAGINSWKNRESNSRLFQRAFSDLVAGL